MAAKITTPTVARDRGFSALFTSQPEDQQTDPHPDDKT
jgi:hypothetical protein